MRLKLLLLLLAPFILTGSNIDGQKVNRKVIISGHVKDSKGSPVPGAIIFVDKEKTRQVTDGKGFYKIKARPDAKEITAFSLNCGGGVRQIAGDHVVDIVISGTYSAPPSKNITGEEEVVNIGYGNVRNKNLTSPVNKLDATQDKYASYSNVYELLRGTVPGVEVKGTSIRIQGANSFMASTEPLFVVDGTVVPTLDDISPHDINSIEVLKGSSAAIYGSRGANGVILITLKNGRNSQK